ncbi:hypothetical protein OO007_12385 [Cocleimonas sp. KMM 6892]|uniref:hypothetical protein n=1 Tax=unclassified Cocleimonas TaxID=2639732 RepID=UPI002DB912BB|nr:MULTISPECIES: hypothetical protein [unclassified Cocleimonas]MEB8433027.1 hypothetical protein [Cocleimonas sp. KMM 6892]MEC4715992.1 hypothetical protein [Cocleimonas sp. KMM 6895]MEC4745453.1 hypothetical protein [Cocleimonas sp. KMM 6896]
MTQTIASRKSIKKAVLGFLSVSALLLTNSMAYAHSGSLNKVAVEVCKQKQKSQACQYQGGHSDLYIGTCQLMSETDLICVRNKPIQKIESVNTDSNNEHKH